MKNTILFLLIIGLCNSLTSQTEASSILPKDLNSAYSEVTMHDKQVLQNIKAEIYQVAEIEIKSFPRKEVIVGIDKNGDNKFEEFIGLQTEENYSLKGTFKAEVIYFRNILVIRSLEMKKETYLFALNGFENSKKIIAEIPNRYKINATEYFGYGLRYHSGNYKFEDFITD